MEAPPHRSKPRPLAGLDLRATGTCWLRMSERGGNARARRDLTPTLAMGSCVDLALERYALMAFSISLR
jgi:hypothetical protein